MYTRQQASQLKQLFWTAFGRYMAPVPAADGNKINWINYKTGVKHIFFRMDASSTTATISIALTNTDASQREMDFKKMLTLQSMLEETLGEAWKWLQHIPDEHGKIISLIQCSVEDVNVFNEASWPAIISFLKPRLIALDAFWYDAKDIFN